MARWIMTGVFFSPSCVDVEGAEALRQVEVDLRGAALPVAADGVAQHVLELRPVERALARVDAGLDPCRPTASAICFSTRGHHVLGVVPQLVGADALLRPGRELDDDLLEAEVGDRSTGSGR